MNIIKKLVLTLLITLPISFYAQADGSTQYTQTKYPIVLVHGMSGFTNALGIDYFYGIPQALRKGGADVHVVLVSAFNSSELRGEQLVKQIEQILALTGAEKVNLIGHSHGSQTSRYAAAMLPSKVASVTAIGGPNTGSPVADKIKELTQKPIVGKGIEHLTRSTADLLGKMLAILSGNSGLHQNSLAGLNSLTKYGAADFNRRFPAAIPETYCGEGQKVVDGVHYYSWSGIGGKSDKGLGWVTNPFDVMSVGLWALTPVFNEATDGLVGRCSSHLGQVIRDDYKLDHLDQVNQVLGITGWFTTNPVSIFRQQANRLKNAGL